MEDTLRIGLIAPVRVRVDIDHEQISIDAREPVQVIVNGRNLVAPLRVSHRASEVAGP